MYFNDLTPEQKTEAKQFILITRNEDAGEGTSYEELARVDDLITDAEAAAFYSGCCFTEEDFIAC